MSDASRRDLYLGPVESVYGTIPAAPAWVPIRNTGGGPVLTKNVFGSNEIRSDGQKTDSRHGKHRVNGEIPFDLSYGTHDTLLQALLRGTWAAKATKTAMTISAAAIDNSFNDSGNGFVTAGFEVGDSITVTGFTGDVANNISKGTITAVTAGKITIGGTDGDVIADDAAGESVTITTRDQVLSCGTTRRSYPIEEKFNDISDEPYHRASGVEFVSLKLQLANDGVVTGSFGIIGQDLDSFASEVASSTYGAATTTSAFDTFTGEIKEGGGASTIVTELSMDFAIAVEPQFVLFSKYTTQPSFGDVTCSLKATLHFNDHTILAKFVDETESTLSFTLTDPAGNSLKFAFPRTKVNGGWPEVKKGPLLLTPEFEALRDPTTGTMLKITRSPV